MTNITLTTTWQEIATTGTEYLLQSTTSGEYFIMDAASQPTADYGFALNRSDSVSSAIYPATNGIWARAKNTQVQIIVDTWA